jgi:hypothetical protein
MGGSAISYLGEELGGEGLVAVAMVGDRGIFCRINRVFWPNKWGEWWVA